MAAHDGCEKPALIHHIPQSQQETAIGESPLLHPFFSRRTLTLGFYSCALFYALLYTSARPPLLSA